MSNGVDSLGFGNKARDCRLAPIEHLGRGLFADEQVIGAVNVAKAAAADLAIDDVFANFVPAFSSVLASMSLARVYGKRTPFGIGLLLVPPVFWIIFGFCRVPLHRASQLSQPVERAGQRSGWLPASSSRNRLVHMSYFDRAVFQPIKMLNNLDAWLTKGVAFAESKSFSTEVLLKSRISPDQFSLDQQIGAACDAGKFMAARLTGVEAPKHPDDELSLEQLQARIKSVIGFLEGFEEPQFEGAAERDIKLPFLKGQSLSGADYVLEMSGPNFYFHLSMAYAVMRHIGVPLGKRDYIGSLRLKPVQS